LYLDPLGIYKRLPTVAKEQTTLLSAIAFLVSSIPA